MWNATCIENRFEITINECGDEYVGTFLDFDDDNGYAVVGNDYNFLDFVTKGESPYAEIKSESYYFSAVGGYFYMQDGEYLNVIEENNTDDSFVYDCVMSKTYDGQESEQTVCGKIVEPDKYVNAKYGGGWSWIEIKHWICLDISKRICLVIIIISLRKIIILYYEAVRGIVGWCLHITFYNMWQIILG